MFVELRRALLAFSVAIVATAAGAQVRFEHADPQKDPFQLLRQRPESENPIIIPQLVRDANRLPPPYLFELARRLWNSDRDQAFEWYAVGMIRAQYDARRCKDTTAHQGIAVLPLAADNVRQGVEPYRAAFGEAGKRALARRDLFDSTVSPMWICIHGMAAVNNALRRIPYGPEDAFTPETEWPALRQKLQTDFAKFFDEQSKPQNDPIALSKTDFKRVLVPAASAGAWLNERQLFFTTGKRVGVWSRDAGASDLGALDGFWCAGNGSVAYQTSREQIEKGIFRVTYMAGTPEKVGESTLVLGAPFRAAQMMQTGSISWSLPRDARRQSPFDCRWVESTRLSGDKNSQQWIPLLPGHGFLQFPLGKGPAGPARLRYFSSEEAEGIELPIPTLRLSLDAVHYVGYRGAYFIAPVWSRFYDEDREAKCKRLWWLYPGGKTEEICIPVDSVHQANAVLFAPSKAGMLRVTRERNTPHGRKIGGVYLTRPDDSVEKLLEVSASAVNVSPDGCSAAIQHFEGFNQKLEVLQLCND